jgi:hypothetical protein
MRRKNKEITDRSEIEEIIGKSAVCRLAVSKDNVPYIIPISFGFDGSNLYLHTAVEGRKIDFWSSNPIVCFEFDSDINTISDEKTACKWTTSFRSVVGYGKISELSTENDKFYALNQIMLHYSGRQWEFSTKDLKGVKLWKIEISELSGKKSHIE